MSIFSKQKYPHPHLTPTQRSATADSRRPHHSPSIAPEQALRQVREAADEARAEIASLVRDEHEAMERAMEQACGEMEKRLRGAAELRIDNELKRIERAEAEMRRGLKKIVRSEVTAAQPKKRRSPSAA